MINARLTADMLRHIPLFAGCEPAHLQVLAFSSERAEFPAGVTMMTAGEAGTAALLLLSGSAEVWTASDAGPKVIAVAKAGTLLGELGMIAGIASSINATASTPIIAARIGRRIFMRVVEEFPEFGTAVLGALAHKLEGSMEDFAHVRRLFEEGNRPLAR
ncbi:cyclic nucleotide-binding domain-containing protein [soil metagenome]